jgi:MFS family permease
MNSAAQRADTGHGGETAGIKVGIWDLAPGISRANFHALLGTAFFSIGLLTLVGNLRPYLFNSMLDIPDDIQGRVSGTMDVVSEIPALLLSGLVGAASDRLGRRVIYGMGFAILAAGYLLFPLAQFNWTLYAMILITACGASLIAAMLSAVIADYPQESSRGKLVGICFFLNGLGVATLVGLAAQLPKFYLAQGLDPIAAGRAAYWTVAALCLVPMVIVLRGLPRRTPGQLATREPLLATLRVGLAAASDRRVRLAYCSAAVSRASLSIISAFFFLWMVQAGKEQGMTPAEALSRGGGIFVAIQITATLWAVTVISFIDRVDRVLFMVVASALASGSYLWFGLVDDPFQPAMYFAAVFLGIGEMSGILASQALIGQVAPERGRGAVIGVFTLCGSLGIFFAALVGGTLFDAWRPSAPYVVMGAVSGLLCLLALATWRQDRRSVVDP